MPSVRTNAATTLSDGSWAVAFALLGASLTLQESVQDTGVSCGKGVGNPESGAVLDGGGIVACCDERDED